MSKRFSRLTSPAQYELLNALRVTLWTIPIFMAIIGAGYTIYEHFQHRDNPGWPWPTYFGIAILGVFGPLISWFVLRWAVKSTSAHFRSQEQLAQRAEELATLNKLSLASGQSLDFKQTITTVLEQTLEALHADAGMVFIQAEGKNGLRLETHKGISLKMAEQEALLVPGHCLCGQAVATGQVLLAGNVGKDPRCTSDLCICEGFQSVACAPLEVKGRTVGLIQLASPEIRHFTAEHSNFLAAVAAQVSVSIENARLYDQVQAFNVELEKKINQRTSELEATQWALAEKARQLQRLLSESYRIQEDTQSRIAHDMHDGVTQMIIGALYETQAARDALTANPERAERSLSVAQELLSEVEGEIRRVIYDLHPPILDMMGLVAALKRFAPTYSTTFGIDCQTHVEGKPRRFAKETEIAVYRIIQAALNNVATHAQAESVELILDFSADRFKLQINDDGSGFEPKIVISTPGEHLGLIGMKERAEGIGADLEVSSAPGSGTSIILHLHDPKYLVQSEAQS